MICNYLNFDKNQRARANQRISNEKANHLRNCAKINQGNALRQEEEGIIKIDETEGEIEMIEMTEIETETIEIEMTEVIVAEEVEDENFFDCKKALFHKRNVIVIWKKINKKERKSILLKDYEPFSEIKYNKIVYINHIYC